MSGFVLNKKVGDTNDGWNHRKSYCRVYSPNDFEFEISIENLLYILENSSSIKGKGIEEEMIFAWDGKDIFLMPVTSPDYQEIQKYSETINANNYIKSKELKIGSTYLSKQNEKFVYMGKFDFWDNDYIYDTKKYELKNKGKRFYFINVDNINKDDKNWRYNYFDIYKSISNKFIQVIDENCHEQYAELFERLECNPAYSPIDDSKDEWINYSFQEFEKVFNDKLKERYSTMHIFDKNKTDLCINRSYDDTYYYNIQERSRIYSRSYDSKRIIVGKSAEEVFNNLQPKYKKIYLRNGKFCRRVN